MLNSLEIAAYLVVGAIDTGSVCESWPNGAEPSSGDIYVYEWVSHSQNISGAYAGINIYEVDNESVATREWTYRSQPEEVLDWQNIAISQPLSEAKWVGGFVLQEQGNPADAEMHRSYHFPIDLADQLSLMEPNDTLVIDVTEQSSLSQRQGLQEAQFRFTFLGCEEELVLGENTQTFAYRIERFFRVRDDRGAERIESADIIYTVDQQTGWWIRAQYPQGEMVLRYRLIDAE